MIPSDNFSVYIDWDTELSPLIYELVVHDRWIDISIYESEEKNVWKTIREIKDGASIEIGFYNDKKKLVRELKGVVEIGNSEISISSKKLSHNDNPAVVFQGYPKVETTKLAWEVEIPVRWDAAV